MFFLRKSRLEPLPVAMSGVRMGERLLQIEVDDPAVAGAVAAKVGLSGSAAIVVSNERRAAQANAGAAKAGALIDVHVTPPHTLPFADASFDAIILHARSGWLGAADHEARQAVLREGHRVLRDGGRLVVIEAGTAHGFAARFRRRRASVAHGASDGTIGALRTAGFKAARVLADREGYVFTEGLKA